jgi:hypothetical protein
MTLDYQGMSAEFYIVEIVKVACWSTIQVWKDIEKLFDGGIMSNEVPKMIFKDDRRVKIA